VTNFEGHLVQNLISGRPIPEGRWWWGGGGGGYNYLLFILFSVYDNLNPLHFDYRTCEWDDSRHPSTEFALRTHTRWLQCPVPRLCAYIEEQGPTIDKTGSLI
jgi:hypothetical protein